MRDPEHAITLKLSLGLLRELAQENMLQSWIEDQVAEANSDYDILTVDWLATVAPFTKAGPLICIDAWATEYLPRDTSSDREDELYEEMRDQ